MNNKTISIEQLVGVNEMVKYEVIQLFSNGYEQHISIADTFDDAKKDIEEFPLNWRHYGPLEIKRIKVVE